MIVRKHLLIYCNRLPHNFPLRVSIFCCGGGSSTLDRRIFACDPSTACSATSPFAAGVGILSLLVVICLTFPLEEVNRHSNTL